MTESELIALAIARGGKVLTTKIKMHPRNQPSHRTVDDPEYQVLVLEGWTPPPLNRIMRGKIATRIQVGSETDDLVKVEAIRQGLSEARGARRVGLVIDWPTRAQVVDPDGIQKALGDALVSANLLLDDTYQMVEWLPPVYWIGKPRTEVHLWDIPEKEIKRRDT